MKIEEQVLTIEQMQHLKELGVEVKDTALCWVFDTKIIHGFPKSTVSVRPYDDNILCSVFVSRIVFTLTLQEILKMLPEIIEDSYRTEYEFQMCKDYICYRNEGFEHDDDRELHSENGTLTAAYNMLVWCAENGYLNKE